MEIKVGDKWSRLSYGEITDVNGQDVQVKDEDGQAWWLSKELVEQQFNMADSKTEIKTVTQTELSAILLSKPGVVMTVNFNKKVNEKDAAELIIATNATSIGIKDAKALAKQILTGEERTMIGRHYHNIDDAGRLQFIDMELIKEIKTARDGSTYDSRLKKVDPRTVNWVIVENIKYKKR